MSFEQRPTLSASSKRVILIVALTALVVAICSWTVSAWKESRQHDFRTYYFAGKAYYIGENPYDTEALSRISGEPVDLQFYYPPLTLPVFAVFSYLDYAVASRIYLVIKSLTLVSLFWFWWQLAPPTFAARITLIAIVMFGFNQTVMRDILSGNISVFEQALLWTGIFALLAGNLRRFTFRLWILSSFKLLSGALLLIGPLVVGRRAVRPLVIASVVMLAIHLFFTLNDPSLAGYFWSGITLPAERGEINPSMLALWRDIVTYFSGHDSLHTGATYALYGLTVVTCVGLFTFAYSRIRHNPALLISSAITVFALIAPRMKDYSYIALILPAVVLCTPKQRRDWLSLGVLVLILIPLFDYQPLVAAMGMFVIILWKAFGRAPALRVENGAQISHNRANI